ncbi:TIM44-like domain-containing protein [Candidatus Magnetominusculus dajiuhuensis]|uniref:Tim44 domain-containing protein n=1 Tax=Candidatus Magnetominusculus dajiuhuensis TaxID=3137712 RepID=UPI003B42F679
MAELNRKRYIVWIVVVFVISLSFADDVLARVGRSSSSGRSSVGSRGSRTSSPPRQPTRTPAPVQQRPVQQPVAPAMQPAPATGGFWRSFAGGMVGGMVGGMLFHALGFGGGGGYGGAGYGGVGGGIGLFDIIVLAIIGYIIYRIVKSKRQQYGSDYGGGDYSSPYQQIGQPPEELSYQPDELMAGLDILRQHDRYFDEDGFRDIVSDIFYKVQTAWSRRDLSPVRGIMASEIFGDLNSDISKMKAEGRINKLENIGVRAVKLSEVWQENGKDFITVEIAASMLDYTTDDAGRVVDGDDSAPVGFLEYWTFVRDIGGSNWQLTAIQQPQ